jgi:hypothetical protein
MHWRFDDGYRATERNWRWGRLFDMDNRTPLQRLLRAENCGDRGDR